MSRVQKGGVCGIWPSEPIPSYYCPKQWGVTVFNPQQTLPRYAILDNCTARTAPFVAMSDRFRVAQNITRQRLLR